MINLQLGLVHILYTLANWWLAHHSRSRRRMIESVAQSFTSF